MEKLNEVPADKPFVIGITGTIGAGKSTVGEILIELGVPVIDTDTITHEVQNSEKVKRAVVERFGKAVLTDDGSGKIDRKKLGALVFKDPGAKRDLEAIIHPLVILESRRCVAAHSGEPLVAILAPLLFEAKVQGEYDEIWAVIASEEVLRKRLSKRDDLTNDAITQRLAAQFSQQEKARLSSVVIDNSGDREETKRQVQVNLEKLQASANPKSS
ncbi:MAG: dephospho-CoA kinase [Candidatus Melainabacteria bacterium]|nr:dephospho-CoA kinase [Candidatus Melainabacteria bacterium]